ncbi:MAG: haloacid dehalogenase [Chitinophagales bacterium]|nr:MAG: haloacid dehalogenase [Chitinophagales bacterium]
MKQALFFDFDGVVLDSVNVKTEAFYEMYLPYGEDIALQAKAYHLHHGGISRFEKFRYFEESLLHRKVSEQDLQKLGTRFSELVFEKVLHAPFIEGFPQFIEACHQHYDCYVVSGTPESELRLITDKRQLHRYFKGIYGSPAKKTDILASLIAQHGYDVQQCYYFGDAMTDLEAAKAHHIRFILVRSSDNRYLEALSDKAIDSFSDLKLHPSGFLNV